MHEIAKLLLSTKLISLFFNSLFVALVTIVVTSFDVLTTPITSFNEKIKIIYKFLVSFKILDFYQQNH